MKSINQILDPISQKGHIDFNQLFIRSLDNNGVPLVKFVAPKWVSKRAPLYHLFSLYAHFVCCFKARGKVGLFLYFDNLSLFLLSYFFNLRHHSMVVHNNLEFALRSPLHRFLFLRIAKSTNLIYLEQRLLRRALENFGHLHADFWPHPILPIPINTRKKMANERNVFVSSRNLEEEQLKHICSVLEKDCMVFCNGFYSHLNLPNLTSGYLEDFDGILANCNTLYLVGSYKFRCSGILYRALSVSKIHIVFSDPSYYKEIAEYIENNRLEITTGLLTV